MIGEIHLEAGIESACVEEMKSETFNVAKFFGKNDLNVILDVLISAKKFWPVLPNLGAYCPGIVVIGLECAHFEKNK